MCNTLRLTPGGWCGAFTAWGWDNREVPLRLTSVPFCELPGKWTSGARVFTQDSFSPCSIFVLKIA